MDTPTLLDRFDAATLALERIRILAGIHANNQLDSEETSLLCELIYETAEKACLSI